MKIATEPREDHQVTLIAEVEPEEFEKSKRQAARKISQDRRIPGFRPGKAPYDMVRRFVGEDVIRQQAIDLLIDDLYPKALDQAEIKPGAPGQLQDISQEEPPKFTFLVPLAPVVELGDYTSVRKPYQAPEVSETEIDQFIERLRTSYATYEPVERPAEEGDMVSVTVSGHLTDPEEGKNPEILENRPLTVVVKPDVEHPEDEWPFPGFAMQMAGHQAGDELTLTHAFSADSPYTSLREHSAEFHAKVDSVKKMNLPELNDEFAQSVGEFADLAGLRDSVRKGLEANAREEYDREYFNQLTDQIISGATIKYPPQMVEDEIHSVLNNIEKDLARQKMDLETYLKLRNQEREAFIDTEVKPSAIRRLERTLMLDEIAHKESIQPDNAEVEATFSQTMAELENTGDIEKLRKQLPMNRLANAVAMEAINRVMNQKVLARLKDIATSEPNEKAQTPIKAADAEGEPAPKKKTRKKAVKVAGEDKPE